MDEIDRFLLVAEVKSISRAAKLLGVSQPALSRTIGLLEGRFGTTLFQRGATGVELTQAGAVLFERAGVAARALRDANEEIAALAGRDSATMSLCAGDSWGFAILPSVIQHFTKLNPGVTVRLDIVDHDTRMKGLENETYDLAFGVVSPGYQSSPGYRWLPMVHATYDVYCRLGHPLVSRGTISQDELLEHGWINHQFEYDMHPAQLRLAGRRYPIRTNTLLNAIELLRGTDYLMSTAKSLRQLLERNGIARLADDERSPVFSSGAAFLARTRMRGPVRKFLRLTFDHLHLPSDDMTRFA